MQLSMFSSAERRASPSASPGSERDWQTRVATSCSPILPLLTAIGPNGWFGRTCPASCQATADGILVPSSGAWANSGMGSPTGFWTLSSSEWNHTLAPSLKDGGVSSLSDVLETGAVPQRYYLSAKACRGILRRAEKRGKALPPSLAAALQAVASERTSIATEDLSPAPETLPTASTGGGMGRIDYETETMIAHATTDTAHTLLAKANSSHDSTQETYVGVAHALRREGHDASEDGTGRSTPIVPVAYRTAGDGAVYEEGDVTAPLTTGTDPNAQVLTLAIRGRGDSHNLEYRQDGTANAVLTPNGGRGGIGVGAIAHGWAVRRLTPLECTRLQGFPDDYFTGLRLNKPFADGPVYKMLGNSMAVNVMSWIGQRIAAVDAIVKGEAAS